MDHSPIRWVQRDRCLDYLTILLLLRLGEPVFGTGRGSESLIDRNPLWVEPLTSRVEPSAVFTSTIFREHIQVGAGEQPCLREACLSGNGKGAC